MPCAENITRPSVRKDLEFWRHHEEVLPAVGWEFLFPIGYLVVSCILFQQWNTEGRKQTRDSLMALKTGATVAFVGYYTSIPLFLAYENMRVTNIVSTGGRYYEFPPSFVVVLDDLVFKGMIATHSISYILVKQLWIALRAETIMISNYERILAKLVKKGNKWVEEVYKDD